MSTGHITSIPRATTFPFGPPRKKFPFLSYGHSLPVTALALSVRGLDKKVSVKLSYGVTYFPLKIRRLVEKFRI